CTLIRRRLPHSSHQWCPRFAINRRSIMRREVVMWETAINLLVAIWLIVTGVRYPNSPGVLIVSGTVAMTFGFYVAAVRDSWQSFVIGMIGLWLFVGPLATNAATTRANFLISGIATGAFGIWVLASRNVHIKSPGWS